MTLFVVKYIHIQSNGQVNGSINGMATRATCTLYIYTSRRIAIITV